MVGAAQREDARAPRLPAPRSDLDRHLQRHLDAHRAGVCEEDVFEAVRCHRHEALRERDRRLVREPTEHHVRQRVELRLVGLAVEA